MDGKKWVLLNGIATRWDGGPEHSHCIAVVCEWLRAHGVVIVEVFRAAQMKVFTFLPFIFGVQKATFMGFPQGSVSYVFRLF